MSPGCFPAEQMHRHHCTSFHVCDPEEKGKVIAFGRDRQNYKLLIPIGRYNYRLCLPLSLPVGLGVG